MRVQCLQKHKAGMRMSSIHKVQLRNSRITLNSSFLFYNETRNTLDWRAFSTFFPQWPCSVLDPGGGGTGPLSLLKLVKEKMVAVWGRKFRESSGPLGQISGSASDVFLRKHVKWARKQRYGS